MDQAAIIRRERYTEAGGFIDKYWYVLCGEKERGPFVTYDEAEEFKRTLDEPRKN